MAAITVISPAMEAHLAGCGDIEKAVKRGRGEQIDQTYEGLTLLDAIVAADEDWADAFGETAYQPNRTHWGIDNMDVKPCLGRAIAKAGITFQSRETREEEGVGRPIYVVTGETVRAGLEQTIRRQIGEEMGYGICHCGCGGRPKGARSRFLPGHDARVKKGGK